MRLLDDIVAPGREDHLLLIDISQLRDHSDRGSIAAELISMNDLWDVTPAQKPGQENLCSFGVLMLPKEDVNYKAPLQRIIPLNSRPAEMRTKACVDISRM